MRTLADRALTVAMTGAIPPDDPHVIAEMQAELDRLTSVLQAVALSDDPEDAQLLAKAALRPDER